jgi:hypothetical protein
LSSFARAHNFSSGQIDRKVVAGKLLALVEGLKVVNVQLTRLWSKYRKGMSGSGE